MFRLIFKKFINRMASGSAVINEEVPALWFQNPYEEYLDGKTSATVNHDSVHQLLKSYIKRIKNQDNNHKYGDLYVGTAGK